MGNGRRAFAARGTDAGHRLRSGEVKAAHQANEYIEIRALIDAVKIISLFMMEWCGVADGGDGADKGTEG